MIKALIFLTIFCVTVLVFVKTMKIKNKFTYIYFLIFSITLIFFVSTFLILNKDKSEVNYIPPVFDGEKIIPGHFNEKN